MLIPHMLQHDEYVIMQLLSFQEGILGLIPNNHNNMFKRACMRDYISNTLTL